MRVMTAVILLGLVVSLHGSLLRPAFPGSAPSETGSSRNVVVQQLRAQGAPCTVVELFPGYPGYRGNITGLMPHWGGQGDYDCLEALERQDLGFDRAAEDRENQSAATLLGITGPMASWTWENWLLIEVQRGMLPSCYSCLMLDPTATPLRPDLAPSADDARIATGLVGSNRAINAIAVKLNLSDSATRLMHTLYTDDYQIRALAYFQDPTLNAPELLQAMTDAIDRLFANNGY